MGCQNICQNNDDLQSIIIKEKVENTLNNNSISSRNIEKSRNQKLNNAKNGNTKSNATNTKNINPSIQQSLNKTTKAFRNSANINQTSIQKNLTTFFIKASNIHKLIPIWIEKNTVIVFNVNGKWGLAESDELFSSMGHLEFEDKPLNMPLGCLAAYIGNGPTFTVIDGLAIETSEDGPMYMFQNTGEYTVTPTGYLEVQIIGGKPCSVQEVQTKLGWDLEFLDTSIPEMNEEETDLLILMNKVRTNPQLFVEQYLTEVPKTEAELELKEQLQVMPAMQRLNCWSMLHDISCTHAKDIGENGLTGHLSSKDLDVEQRLNEKGIMRKKFAENCILGYNDPLEIIMKLLICEDNENRNQRTIILNPDFSVVGISIFPHKGVYRWSCVQNFIDLPIIGQNDDENENENFEEI